MKPQRNLSTPAPIAPQQPAAKKSLPLTDAEQSSPVESPRTSSTKTPLQDAAIQRGARDRFTETIKRSLSSGSETSQPEETPVRAHVSKRAKVVASSESPPDLQGNSPDESGSNDQSDIFKTPARKAQARNFALQIPAGTTPDVPDEESERALETETPVPKRPRPALSSPLAPPLTPMPRTSGDPVHALQTPLNNPFQTPETRPANAGRMLAFATPDQVSGPARLDKTAEKSQLAPETLAFLQKLGTTRSGTNIADLYLFLKPRKIAWVFSGSVAKKAHELRLGVPVSREPKDADILVTEHGRNLLEQQLGDVPREGKNTWWDNGTLYFEGTGVDVLVEISGKGNNKDTPRSPANVHHIDHVPILAIDGLIYSKKQTDAEDDADERKIEGDISGLENLLELDQSAASEEKALSGQSSVEGAGKAR